MKVGTLVRHVNNGYIGEIGVIIGIKHGIEIYVVHFSNSGERWLIAPEMEVIGESR